MTKKFGQNFLVSLPHTENIVKISGAKPGIKVWEIGPGIGALTSRLLATGAHVTCFEIDHGFCRILREEAFTDDTNFTLIEGDALKTWKQVYLDSGKPDLICANLPYNVGSVLIASFIENRFLPQKMVYTLQSEVVQRICADRDDSEYSGFSILTSIDYINREALRLKPGCFWPAPNVDSSVVEMTLREKPLVPEELAVKFIETVRILFAQRRKTVRNNLKALSIGSDRIDTALEKAGINPLERAEKLSVEQITSLTAALLSL